MIWLLTLPIVAVLFFVLWKTFFRAPSLPAHRKAQILRQWQDVLSRTDNHRKIMEADSVLTHLLDALGFKGTTGEKLKKAGKYLPDLQGVWNAHKLRNRIAHEPGIQVQAAEVNRAMASFEKVIRKFC